MNGFESRLRHLQSRWNDIGCAWHCALLRVLWLLSHAYFCVRIAKIQATEWNLPAVVYPFPVLEYFSLIPQSVLVCGLLAHFVCIFFLLIGKHTRVVQVLIVLISVPIFLRSASYYSNHLSFYLIISFFMMFMPSERYFSSDALKRKFSSTKKEFLGWQEQRVPLLPIRLCMMTVGMLYLFSAYHKVLSGWTQRWIHTEEALYFVRGDAMRSLWSRLIESGAAAVPVWAYVLLLAACGFGAFSDSRKKRFVASAFFLHAMMVLHEPDPTVIQFAVMVLSVWVADVMTSFRPDRAKHAWLM